MTGRELAAPSRRLLLSRACCIVVLTLFLIEKIVNLPVQKAPGSTEKRERGNEKIVNHPVQKATGSTEKQERGNEMVPFYLYPFQEFPSFWGRNSSCNHAKSFTSKHDHADFAWQAMMQHPWRTSNPKEAQLAILPLSLDLWARGGCGHISIDMVKEEIRRVLDASSIFPNVRHLFIANDFKTKRLVKPIMEVLSPAGILAKMEGRGDCQFGLGYTSNYAVTMSMRSPNHVEIPNPRRFGAERIYSVHMVGQVDGRHGYVDRVALFQSTGYIPSPYIIVQRKSKNSVHEMLRDCTRLQHHQRSRRGSVLGTKVIARRDTKDAGTIQLHPVSSRGHTWF